MEPHSISSGMEFLPEVVILFTLFPGAYQLLQRLCAHWRIKYQAMLMADVQAEQFPEEAIAVEEEEVLLKETSV